MKCKYRYLVAAAMTVALLFSSRGNAQNNEAPTITISGATACPTDSNYFIIQIPTNSSQTVTVTASGGVPPIPTNNLCTNCSNSYAPATNGSAKYTFSSTSPGNQAANNGATISIDVSSTTQPKEYTFQVTKVTQSYESCTNPYTGGASPNPLENTMTSSVVTLLAFQIQTETVATTPADRTRKKLGVGEEVNLTFKPPSIPINWYVESNKGTVAPPTGSTTKYTAHNAAAEGKVKAEFKGLNELTSFNIIEPSGETAVKDRDETWPSGVQGAGMHLIVTVTPTDVSFYNVEVLEVDKGTVNVSGYFTNFPSSVLKHVPNSKWIQLTDANIWTDLARFYNWGSPWKQGTYQWNIDVLWHLVGSSGSGKKFNSRTQLHEIIDSTGKSKESKMDCSSTRSP
jgi:hypothetical protein